MGLACCDAGRASEVSYLYFFISGRAMAPIAAAVAVFEPQMARKWRTPLVAMARRDIANQLVSKT